MKFPWTKRAMDLALVVGSAPIWVPLLGVIAGLVRMKLGSPVLFRQLRPGLRGCVFELIKFRTMLDERDAAGNPLPDELRLTAFGRWLRASSLDELPELWNVLKGDMSLVGPRPLLIQYLPRYTVEQRRRHEVLPGLTGWAQVNGRNALSWEARFRMDVWYVENQTLALDLKIIALTIVSVLKRRGVSAEGHATMPEFNPNSPARKL